MMDVKVIWKKSFFVKETATKNEITIEYMTDAKTAKLLLEGKA